MWLKFLSSSKLDPLQLAEQFVQQGKFEAAIAEYEKSINEHPDEITTINILGDLYARLGRADDAIKCYKHIAREYQARGFFVKAIAMHKKISKIEPYNSNTALALAELYASQGSIVEARQQYMLVINDYRNNQMIKEELAVYHKIVELDPNDAAMVIKLAERYHEEGLVQHSHDVYLQAGQIFLRKKIYTKAIELFQWALFILPNSKIAANQLVEIFIQQNLSPYAFDLLKQLQDQNPGDWEWSVMLARAYLTAEMLDEAEAALQHLMELDKSFYAYLLEVGYHFIKRNQFDRALAIVDRCLEYLISSRQEESGIGLLKAILAVDTDNLAALNQLARIYKRIHSDFDLIGVLKMIVDIALRHSEQGEAIRAINELILIEPDEAGHKQLLARLTNQPQAAVATQTTADQNLEIAAPQASHEPYELTPSQLSELGSEERSFEVDLSEIFIEKAEADSPQSDRQIFEKSLAREWRRCARNAMPLTMVLIDLDFLKTYCDNYDYEAGQQWLQKVAQVLQNNVRGIDDLVIRYSSQEFAIILPQVNENVAKVVLARLHKAISSLGIDHLVKAATGSSAGLHFGAATIIPKENSSVNLLLATAKKSLQQSKSALRRGN
jgi:diguanylate cyclase (GGDEF)-like protein